MLPPVGKQRIGVITSSDVTNSTSRLPLVEGTTLTSQKGETRAEFSSHLNPHPQVLSWSIPPQTLNQSSSPHQDC
jgi:hypothetical protein